MIRGAVYWLVIVWRQIISAIWLLIGWIVSTIIRGTVRSGCTTSSGCWCS